MIRKLILGTVQFGLDYGVNNNIGKPTIKNIYKILDYAYENDIKTLDTAESYGNAHQIIANYLKTNKTKNVIWIYFEGNDPEDLDEELRNKILKKYLENNEIELIGRKNVEFHRL